MRNNDYAPLISYQSSLKYSRFLEILIDLSNAGLYEEQIEKKSDIIKAQARLIEVTGKRVEKTRTETISNITQRHTEAAEVMKSAVQEIMANSEEINKTIYENAEIIEDDSEYISENKDILDDLFNELNSLK